MSTLGALAMAAGEQELNPLLPSPAALVALLIIGALVVIALLATGVFHGMRFASAPRTTETSREES